MRNPNAEEVSAYTEQLSFLVRYGGTPDNIAGVISRINHYQKPANSGFATH